MPYGNLKADTLNYSTPTGDVLFPISGITYLGSPLISGGSGVFTNVNATTISGTTVTGTNCQFVTVTGGTGQFTTLTGGTAGFTTVTGTTITGTTVNAVYASFSNTITGVTVTGTTANFSNGNFTGTLSGNTTNDSKGNVRAIPQNSQATTYTLVTGDSGKHIFAGGTVVVPSGVFAVGDAVTIYNNTAGAITISGGTNVTLRQAGTANTGNRSLAQRGLATLLCVSGTADFVINGGGLT